MEQDSQYFRLKIVLIFTLIVLILLLGTFYLWQKDVGERDRKINELANQIKKHQEEINQLKEKGTDRNIAEQKKKFLEAIALDSKKVIKEIEIDSAATLVLACEKGVEYCRQFSFYIRDNSFNFEKIKDDRPICADQYEQGSQSFYHIEKLGEQFLKVSIESPCWDFNKRAFYIDLKNKKPSIETTASVTSDGAPVLEFLFFNPEKRIILSTKGSGCLYHEKAIVIQDIILNGKELEMLSSPLTLSCRGLSEGFNSENVPNFTLPSFKNDLLKASFTLEKVLNFNILLDFQKQLVAIKKQ